MIVIFYKNIMNNIIPFEQSTIRKTWHNEQWYFSVIDVVGVLIQQPDFKKAKSYWTTLKNRLKNEGSELVTKCDQLKMVAQDGKMPEKNWNQKREKV
jgi:hypothetical protein